jgi:hypothetical protein
MSTKKCGRSPALQKMFALALVLCLVAACGATGDSGGNPEPERRC